MLYEMLTGRRLFDAEDISERLAAVLTRDVSLTSVPADIPPRLRTLLRDCLIRDPKQRLRDIGDARLVLEKMITGAPDDLAPEFLPSSTFAPSVRLSLTPDGRSLTFSTLRSTSNLWLMDGLTSVTVKK